MIKESSNNKLKKAIKYNNKKTILQICIIYIILLKYLLMYNYSIRFKLQLFKK